MDYMCAELRGSLFGEQIVRFFRRGKGEEHVVLPFHRFQQGDVVIVSKTSPIKDAVLEGVIMERNQEAVLITTRDAIPKGFTSTKWVTTVTTSHKSNQLRLIAVPFLSFPFLQRLDKSEDLMTVTKCIEAIQSLTRIPYKPLPELDVPIKVSSQLSVGVSQELLPLFIEDGKTKAKDIAAMPPGEPLLSLYRSKEPPADFECWELNESQANAIRTVPQRRLSLIKGPPGTGKTSTAIRLIQYLSHFLKGNKQGQNYPILATAFTNVNKQSVHTLYCLAIDDL